LQHVSRFEHFDIADHYCCKETGGRRVELNPVDCSHEGIDRCFEGVVGDGGFIPIGHIAHKHVKFAPAASISASAAGGGIGAPAESRRVGMGRSIGVAKKGGRSGLIGGDGRDSLRDVEMLRNEGLRVNGTEGRGIVKSLVEHIESKAFAKDIFIDQASVHVSSH
jgi:hypothetical protein